MNPSLRILQVFKALRELGPDQLSQYGLYRFGLLTGHYRRQLQSVNDRLNRLDLGEGIQLNSNLLPLPERQVLLNVLGEQVKLLYEEADQIVNGQFRLLGGPAVPLILNLPFPLDDWSIYEMENDLIDGQDIKMIWEPGRFGWACTLARAYYLSGEERYADSFWYYTENFFASNPPYAGPHWSSAQEAAIRLIALVFSAQLFAGAKSTTPHRLELLAQAIVFHAERIPPTLAYSRSQGNNHLITEALGLYTASAVLPKHPYTARWHKQGWHWLTYGFCSQISADGTYVQHSTNYHRLMLQAALWTFAIHRRVYPGEPLQPELPNLLERSTKWIWKLLDPETGRVPNLGHNDGSYILPLTVCPYTDYRPVIHAAAQIFLHCRLEPEGPWNEMTHWLCRSVEQAIDDINLDDQPCNQHTARQASGGPHVLVNPHNGSWAMLRAASFHARPAHADQLHLDFWWRGLNLAQDPGTYRYNSMPPWDNSLTSALAHNTVVVDGRDTMQKVGRFLYLDWAQAKVIAQESGPDGSWESITAEHNGYRKMGVVHTRKVATFSDGHWEVTDRIHNSSDRPHTVRLHWLLPDWEYELSSMPDERSIQETRIRIHSPYGWITLRIDIFATQGSPLSESTFRANLVRAGEILAGTGTASEISGWTSPTYGVKIPGLAYIIEVNHELPIEIMSQWFLPDET